MKKKALQNNNGIVICDSIVMSVKKKRIDLRKPEAVFIAVLGFVSVIMSFLGMFEFYFNVSQFVTAAAVISLFYIILSLRGGKASWIILGSVGVFAISAYRNLERITKGFQFVYNIIYSDSYHTSISYYKFLKPGQEEECVTVFFIFCIWLLAIIIYFFTIYRPNPILPLLATFPILEVGLYNGIEIPVVWGVLTVAYWLALLSMSTIDVGEFTGGTGGFVRKDNLFFPKRQMRLKVTEKCGMIVIVSTLLITLIASAVIKLTEYERSDEINRKRVEIRDAFNSFSVENLAESVSKLTSAFGFTFDYESHKLGNTDRLKFKNVTDLIVTFDRAYDGAVYLKEYTGSVYDDNEWKDLEKSAYDDSLFDDFEKYGIYPQDFPCMFNKFMFPEASEMTMWIKSKVSDKKSFTPYGTDNYDNLTYDEDRTVSSKVKSESEFSYKFLSINADSIAASLFDEPIRNVYSVNSVSDEEQRNSLMNYCVENNLLEYDDYFTLDYEIPDRTSEYLYANGNTLIAELLQSRYKNFVYKYYLQVPDNSNMDEIREEYSDILSYASTVSTPQERLAVLSMLREKIEAGAQYNLSPGKTPSNRDFANYFLLENHKGYCIHYATAGVILARMAGIPARYATGYVIVSSDFNDDSLNPDGTYTIDVKDNRSHAWAEVYINGYGWIPFEFTAGYSSSSVAQTTSAPPEIEETTTTETISATEKNTDSPANTTQTSRKKSSSASATTTTTTTTTVTTSAIGGIFPGGSGGGTNKTLPKSVKIIISIIISIAAIAGIIMLRRYLILKRRKYLFTTGKAEVRAGHMYSYAEKLLNSIDLANENMRFNSFADYAEKHCAGKYFRKGDFRKFTDISLRAGFSPEPPDKDDMRFCREFVGSLSNSIYEKSGFVQKLIMKLVTVLN